MSRDEPLVAIVDDDESVRRSVRNLLHSVGYRVATFSSAEDFLCRTTTEEIRCLLLDLGMPGMSGLDLLEELAARESRIPVVVLTAHDDETQREYALKAGATAFLAKPFVPDVLIAVITSAVRQAS